MKYQGCLLAVTDMAASKHFYEKVLHQNVLMDMGVHVTFDGISDPDPACQTRRTADKIGKREAVKE